MVLLSLLLFFEFGTQWSLGKLATLIPYSPARHGAKDAIFMLALYFGALLVGRIVSQVLLHHFSHTEASAGREQRIRDVRVPVAELHEHHVGVAMATVVTGFAFAPFHALVARNFGRRFDYQPGFFNGIFSLAITGGMLAPSLLGFVGHYLGMQYVMLIPAAGSIAVRILMLLITLEAKLMGGGDAR